MNTKASSSSGGLRTPFEADEGYVPRFRTRKEEWESVSLVSGYRELSRRSFAVWIRLHQCIPGQLKLGRNGLRKILCISMATWTRVLRELEDSGYVVVHSKAYKNRTTIELVKRARIRGQNFFVKT